MSLSFMKNDSKKSTLFLSDLHLQGRDDPRQKRLIDFLEAHQGEIETLVIAGDLFDFWIGYHNVVYSQYLPLLSKLEDLARNGTQIVIFEGNHDFFLGPYFTEVLGAAVYPGPAPLHVGNYRVWVCHGDQLDPRVIGYRILRWILRTPLVRWGARFLHPDLLWKIGQWASRTSRRNQHPMTEKRRESLFDYAKGRFE